MLPGLWRSLDRLESIHLGDCHLLKTWLKLGKQLGETMSGVITCTLLLLARNALVAGTA